ncbi:LLM class flavin-dependent oxidoreductase [Streptomyces sp. ICN988]|uniref:MupA/Atu3671 family FMN-dependent luciferase-like monooxygenase n=1 Tax=Streptomyces sp. ICN988 TaxID=2983765 RepID=UPI0021E48597|nr:MupA/Atu3671 family FMN-dependent luciferase-like monooxygenase [Streptomyces sp. ICN988]MCV2458421.1 LLM class flavin-dependent oxidoreductase [Streptomyces sp. ICN988]
MDLSLFYFADEARGGGHKDRYRLLLEGARFADTHGFSAVWTPERHFHPFGGNYPNPAVTGAAVATVTERVQIRAGSVVAPLHHVLRIAEDWAVVDNLSGGRVGISLASGWNPEDFILGPGRFGDRSRTVLDHIDTLRSLWRGEPFTDPQAVDAEGPRIHPLPVQSQIPLWLTTAGNPDTFRAAGRARVGVLTHLASQGMDELAERITQYRKEFTFASGGTGTGHVVLMLHAFLGADQAAIEREVREPLENYLISALNLFNPQGGGARGASGHRARLAVRSALQRYLHQGCALLGTTDRAEEVVRECERIGVDEIACLIDFGVPTDRVLHGLTHLAELRARVAWGMS